MKTVPCNLPHVHELRCTWGFQLRSRQYEVHEDFNMIAMIGTSDQACWLERSL